MGGPRPTVGGPTLEQVGLGWLRMLAEHEPWREQGGEQHFFLILPSDSCLAVLPDSPQGWAVMECESSTCFLPKLRWVVVFIRVAEKQTRPLSKSGYGYII